MKIEIKNRWTDAVIYTADISDDIESGLQMRAALEQATVAKINLGGANLSGANLSDANLIGAQWRNGITINRAPLQLSGLYWMVYILDDHMQIGCELHTLAEWSAFDDARIVEMGGKNALRFWRNHNASLLALAASDGRGVKTEQAEQA